jgi:hypothetical protein
MLEEEIGVEILEQTRRRVTLPRAAGREVQLRDLRMLSEDAPPRPKPLRRLLAMVGGFLEESARKIGDYTGHIELD